MTETRSASFELEATDPYCTDPETAADRLRHQPWKRFAVLGDSVTAGVRGPLDGYRDESFAERLVHALGAPVPASRR